MRLRCGDDVFETAVREKAGALEVTVAGRSLRLVAELASPGMLVARDGRRLVTLHFAREGKTVHLFWDGVAYSLAEEHEGDRASRRHESGALEAPMPGRVAAVRVTTGQRVAKGEELVVVEAMKMENALRSPRDGVVAAVHAKTGDMVAPGRDLVELEADGER
jgi:3-methylcrotonyl-CoA carboxylase alpha subunit